MNRAPAAMPRYNCDPIDRITDRGTSTGGPASTLAYNPDDQLCWSDAATVTSAYCHGVPTDATTYTFNASGDRTTTTPATGDPTSYAYNEADQLSTVTTVTTTASYTYDGDGLRTTTTTTGTTHDTWNQTTPVPLLLTDGTNDYLYRPDGTPIEQIDPAGTITYLHTDQAGTVRLLTNTTGTITGTATYDPYGTLTTSTGTLSPLGHDGQYTDPTTGLIYLRARYYDPATPAFLTPDPLVDTTHQPYEYANDDPINNTDPLGLCAWNPFGNGSCFTGAENAIGHGLSDAWNAASMSLANFTVGTCVNLGVGGATYFGVSGCTGLSGGHPFVSGSIVFGGGSPSGSVTRSILLSNAKSPSQLSGTSATAGGSIDTVATFGLEGSAGNDSCGAAIWAIQGSAGLSIPLPWGAETHAGITHTWVYSF